MTVHEWPIKYREPEGIVPRLGALRSVHSGHTGVESALRVLPENEVLLTNAGSQSMAAAVEHVLALLLAMARRLPEHFRATDRKKWVTPQARVLNGSTVMILGLGRIGSEVARISSALGCHVIGVRRNSDLGVPEGVSSLIPPDRIHADLGKADFVVLALPVTPHTTDLVDREFLAAMKSDAALINVGRGETIVDKDLVDAQRRGYPSAACLDVTRQQPLPRDSQLYKAPNLWLTPFTAYQTGGGEHGRKAERLFLEDLGRFVQGQPLLNQVDPGQGY